MSNTKRTERVTPASRDTLLTMIETLPGAFFLLNDTDTIVYANRCAQALTGVTADECVGAAFWRCAPQLVSTVLYQAVRKTRETRELTEVEYVSPVTQRWLHVHLAPTVGGLTLQFHEGRAPTRSPQLFSQGERLSINDLDGLQTMIGILTLEGIVLDINADPLEDAQVQREEVIGKPLAETPWWSSSPASQEQLRTAIARANTGETGHFEALLRLREGMLLHFEGVITPHLDADHHVEYLVIASIDITVRKRAEGEVHALIDAIPQLVWSGRPDGYIDYYNQRWLDYTGLSTEQAQGNGWMQCTHPDDRQRVLAVWQNAVQTGGLYETEQRLRQSTTGAYRWFLMQAVPFKDGQGTILSYIGTCTDIDDRKQAEQRLKESREHLRVLAETVPQLVWSTGPDGLTEDWNQRFANYFQATPEQLRGYGWRQFLHPEEYDHVRAVRDRSLETGEPYEIEYRLKDSQTGSYRWFLARALPARDETGQIVKWFGTCTDIEDKKQAEEELHVLIDAIPQLVWILRPDGSSEYGNQRWCDYTAMTFQQYQGDGWLQAIHPDDYQHTLTLWRHACASGEPFEIEYRLKNGQTGTYRWFLARAMPVRNEAGQIVKWFGTCTDIEEQKRAEGQIKTSEEHLRVLAETVPQMVWASRPNGQHEYANQRWCDYTGLTVEHMQSNRWAPLQCIHPDDQDGTRTLWQHALDTGAMYEHEERFRNSQTGAYRWFLARAMPVRNEAGQIVKWFGTCTDIEEQKRTEEALRHSQERASALMNSSIIGIFVTDDDQVVEANESYLRMTGYTQDDLQEGRINWVRMTPPEYAAQTQQARQELAVSRHVTRYEKEYLCKDGSRLPVVLGGVAVRLNPLQVIGFVLDNSAHKELEQRKDAFISMASHELRNPLTALKLQTTLLHRQLARQDTLDQAPALASMETQINKVSRLVEELLDVSKIQAGRLEYVRETVDLDALLQEITDMMQQTSPGHRILVHGSVGTNLIGDPDRLGQVFINLISNAIKYSPDAETVEIDLSTFEGTVIVQVRDHGLGIPREQRDKIFDRFYRASGPKQKAIPGLGMGLYIVREIVKGHGGTITVDSTIGKGSTFTVTLPRKGDA